jgi:hypothetical protein
MRQERGLCAIPTLSAAALILIIDGRLYIWPPSLPIGGEVKLLPATLIKNDLRHPPRMCTESKLQDTLLRSYTRQIRQFLHQLDYVLSLRPRLRPYCTIKQAKKFKLNKKVYANCVCIFFSRFYILKC